MENVYGVLVADKRHTLMYMHFYDIESEEVIDRVKTKTAEDKNIKLGEAK